MGIKMNRARSNGRVVNVDDFNRKIHRDLICLHCSARVTFVSQHEKHMGTRRIEIKKHFRLSPKFSHSEGCKYTVLGEIKDIYAKCADRNFFNKTGSKYVLRLLFVNKPTRQSLVEILSNSKGENPNNTINYIKSGKKTAYLSTIRRIIKLRSLLENDIELQNSIILHFLDNNKIIDVLWQYFYFDITIKDNLERLFVYLKEKNPKHPMCIYATVSAVNHINNDLYCVKTEAYNIAKSERLTVEIYTNKAIAEEFKAKAVKNIAVYSNFVLKNKPWAGSIRQSKLIFHNITCSIYDSRQIMLLDN